MTKKQKIRTGNNHGRKIIINPRTFPKENKNTRLREIGLHVLSNDKEQVQCQVLNDKVYDKIHLILKDQH